jgi:hypothetical protein
MSESCPTGCGRKIKFGHLMCKPCWGEVPEHLQRRVYETLRTFRGSLGPERKEALAKYREAADEAIGSIK